RTPLGMTLELLARYGDAHDAPEVERIMNMNTELFRRAFYTLHRLDREVAVANILHRLESARHPCDRADLLLLLLSVDEKVDVAFLLEFGVADLEDVVPAELADQCQLLQQRVRDDLGGKPELRQVLGHRLVEMIAQGEGYSEMDCWWLARKLEVPGLHELALQRMGAAPPGVLGAIAQYFAELGTGTVDRDALTRICRERLFCSNEQRGWLVARLTRLMSACGNTEGLPEYLDKYLANALVRYHEAAAAKSPVELMTQFDICESLEAALAYADQLTGATKLGLLSLHPMVVKKQGAHVRRLVQGVPGPVLDRAVSALSGSSKWHALSIIAALGTTEQRLGMLQDGIRECILAPMVSGFVMNAAEHMWDARTARVVIDTFSSLELPDDADVYTREFLGAVAQRMDMELAEHIEVNLLPIVRNSFVLKTLRLWVEIGKNPRFSNS
ncbi:MAG: hypothetical protein WC712_15275, partial [Candidatus Brocadiia bacterium]